MKQLTARDFCQFFQDLHGTAPFPWQCRLAELVSASNGGPSWPRQIALPTASGKTACIDIALFALACAASRAESNELTAPRRIFFVVDRRIIVDQAYKRACLIRETLSSPDKTLLKAVAENLRDLARGPHDEEPAPLECFQLRGGVYRDDGWARSPIQPMVVCATVDQLGSRLLFRGYGRSWKVWPVYAGLAGNDSLILLDEAHCSAPFAETAEAVRRYHAAQWAGKPLVAPLSVSVMSATLRYDEESPFLLEADDYADARLGPRLLSDKFARLADEIKGKTATRGFAEALVKEAFSLADQGARRIAIMVNRVQSAKQIFDLLADIPRHRKELFIGRMRPIDSRRLTEDWEPRLRSDADRTSLNEPVFIVATQCLEVGADYDFDGIVSECASLDALRQRFGRLKRLGIGKCWSTIMISSDDAKGKLEDPIYGTALAATWQWLKGQSLADGESREAFVNMGVQAMADSVSSLSPNELESLIPFPRHAPVLLPSHVDRWVQTSPVPQPDPDVSLFLHGNQENIPEAQVCWRSDLDLNAADIFDIDDDRQDRWIASLSLCPPAAAECMPVPLWLVRRWLAGVKVEKSLLADVDGVNIADEAPSEEQPFFRALRWCGPEDEDTRCVADPEEVRPGDTIVVPAAYGRWSDLGHIPNLNPSDQATDLGDEANFMARNRPVLRIYPGAPRNWCIGCDSLDEAAFEDASSNLFALLAAGDLIERFSEVEWRNAMRDCLAQLGRVGGVPDWLRDIALVLAARALCPGEFHVQPGAGVPDQDGPAGLTLVGRRRAIGRYGADTFTSEDESSASTTEVALVQHLSGVAKMAGHFAVGCRLSPELQRSLTLAGRLHDLGKLDIRFQAWLHSGNLAEALAAPGPLAKSSGRDDRRSREAARRRSGYPRGGRHELLSLLIALKHCRHLLTHDVDEDLVLHLVASHHGHCRPFAPYLADNQPPEVSWTHDELTFNLTENDRQAWNPASIDSGISDRFWRLVRRYGWWGLAWLESIFVLADWRQSEREMDNNASANDVVTRAEVPV